MWWPWRRTSVTSADATQRRRRVPPRNLRRRTIRLQRRKSSNPNINRNRTGRTIHPQATQHSRRDTVAILVECLEDLRTGGRLFLPMAPEDIHRQFRTPISRRGMGAAIPVECLRKGGRLQFRPRMVSSTSPILTATRNSNTKGSSQVRIRCTPAEVVPACKSRCTGRSASGETVFSVSNWLF